jgi:hypothetical protein
VLTENVGHVRRKREFVVFGVSADPKPYEIFTRLDRERTMVQAHA